MSNFPNSYDDDTTLPAVNDNITQIGGLAINSLRDFAFNTEMYLGIGANGSTPSIAARLGVSLNPDGSINPSALTSLGLVTLPITQDEIATNAAIPESKLLLNYPTVNLFNAIQNVTIGVNEALGWIATTGVELQPHLMGAIYRHSLDQIDVSHNLSVFPYLLNKFSLLRNNTQSYYLISDINSELLYHQWADGSPQNNIKNVTTIDGSTYTSNYAHVASGIFIDTAHFQTIPQTAQDTQAAFEFIDESGIFLLGTRIQNLYANGIPVNSRSSSLTADGYGQPIVPVTTVTAYLLGANGTSSSPVDDINYGDDIVKFTPTPALMASNFFDTQFASVKVGDILTINYGTVEVAFVILEVKYNQMGVNKTYIVRIAGKNLAYTTTATARIDRPLFNNNKFGVLATASANSQQANNVNIPASLIISNPRGAQCAGVGFNADQFDNKHYLLYLALYPDGNPNDGYVILPAIDVTGNQGLTPGSYTLSSVVTATNAAFRQAGFNYRFIAFESNGEFGIMLADSYNNASFSILNMVVSSTGTIDPVNTAINFPNNVVGAPTSTNLPDPLGLGFLGANFASPAFMTSYGSAAASQFPTKLFVPLRRNNYYVNGVEREQLNLEPFQVLDQYGDGYWVATIDGYTVTPGPNGRVQTTYNIPINLSTSDLKVGKTIVVQSLGFGSLVDFGRFIISNITFVNTDCTNPYTLITVYDSVHAIGMSPSSTLATIDGYGDTVAIYFNSDSVAFDQENATDFTTPVGATFKRLFEVYVNGDGDTFTHERARLNTTGANITVNNTTVYGSPGPAFVNLVDVSPKLLGYASSSVVRINLQILSYDVATGLFDGYLCNYNGTTGTNAGPLTTGQKGQVTRFYDQSNIDYIDIIFSAVDNVPLFTNQNADIQLFPTLSLDQEVMLLSTCQFNTVTYQTSYLTDARQFGNISEEQLTTSALNYISAADQAIHENGIIRGFGCALYGDIVTDVGTISFDGGEAFINGKLVQIDPQTVTIPVVLEALPVVAEGAPTIASVVPIITWFVCANQEGEIELVASTDYDPFGAYVAQYTAANLTHLRLFYAVNPNAVSLVPYQIRSTYFANLVLTQQDLVPIAIVGVSVTNPGTPPTGFVVTSMSVNDVRRYVTKGYGGLTEPLTLGNNASFRNFDSLLNWLLQFNNLYSASTSQGNPISNKVIVKGHVSIFNSSPAITLGYIFGEVFFEGDNGVFDVYVPTGFELQSNIHFNKLIFNYLYDPVAYNSIYGDVTDGYYIAADLINASRNTFATGKGLIHIGIPGNSGVVINVSVTNCHFTWQPLLAGLGGVLPFVPPPAVSSIAINRYSFITVEFAQVLPSSNALILQNVDISNNTFRENTLSTFSPQNQETARAAIAFVCLANEAFIYKLINVTITGNVCDKDQMIAIVPINTAISSTPNVVNAAFDTTGCIIENNICGSISVFTQYGAPFDQDFTENYLGFTLDKNNGLSIKNNTCKYITSTDARGVDLVANVTSILVNSGPINISDNTTSWIKLPLNVVASFPIPAATVIKNNTLIGYDTNFRLQYLNGSAIGAVITGTFSVTAGSQTVHTSVSQVGLLSVGSYITFGSQTGAYYRVVNISAPIIEIDVNYSGISNAATVSNYVAISNAAIELVMIGNNFPNNVIIDGNNIAPGLYDTIVPLFTQFTYDFGIWTQHDGDICNNTISGLLPTLNPLVNPIGIQINNSFANVNSSCNIHHNKLARNGIIWRAYIDISNANGNPGDHTIVNNFFDLLNADNSALLGSNQITSNGSLSNIHDNINQVISTALSLVNSEYSYNGFTSGNSNAFTNFPTIGAQAFSATGPANSYRILLADDTNSVALFRFSQSGGAAPTSNYVGIVDYGTGSPTSVRNFSFNIPLTDHLPPGVKVLSASIGVWVQTSGAATFYTASATANAFTLSLVSYANNLSAHAGFPITDVKNNIIPNLISPGSDITTGIDNSFTNNSEMYTLLISAAPSVGAGYAVVTPAFAASQTNYLIVNTSVAPPLGINYATGYDYRINATFDLNYIKTGGSSPNDVLVMYFSPILVTYKW